MSEIFAFNPNTDDMCEASSRDLIKALFKCSRRRPFCAYAVRQKNETLNNADALAIVIEWNEFRSPEFDKIKNTLSNSVVFDGRNLYEPGLMQQLGFKYYAIDRGDPISI